MREWNRDPGQNVGEPCGGPAAKLHLMRIESVRGNEGIPGWPCKGGLSRGLLEQVVWVWRMGGIYRVLCFA